MANIKTYLSLRTGTTNSGAGVAPTARPRAGCGSKSRVKSPSMIGLTAALAGWYEEDCDAALVILSFQNLFTADAIATAGAIFAGRFARKGLVYAGAN